MQLTTFTRCVAFVASMAASTAVSARAEAPEPAGFSRISSAGNYLAARHANTHREIDAASRFYRAALRANPGNPEILERTFFAVLADGEVEEAAKLAERLVARDPNNSLAHLVLGVREIKQQRYVAARRHLAKSVRGPIADLTANLLAAWTEVGSDRVTTAIKLIDQLSGPEWYAVFKDLHSGLIADMAGREATAGKRLERAYQLDQNALRSVQAYARWASRHKGTAEALKVLETFEKAVPRHPIVTAEIRKLRNKEPLPVLIDSARTGAAEVLYGLGASIGRQGGEDLGLIYLRLSLYLAPKQPLTLLSLADLFETLKKPRLAISVYEQVPKTSPLRRNAEIQLAVNLDALDPPKTAEARQHLEKLIEARGGDVDATMALGNILRSRKFYAECAQVYGKVIDTYTQPTKNNWVTFYFRGICYERSKQWPLAEADLKKALELFPDQPQVLNYLGYSWVDQGVHLDQGMDMIRRAVEKRPDDGYIVDSLGWAYYRLGNYTEAVKHLERAVELNPQDATINDHLGDGYWRVGRHLEARFQWAHARDLILLTHAREPNGDHEESKEELKKVEEKLRNGLQESTSTSAGTEKPGNGG